MSIKAFERGVLPWIGQYDEAAIPQTLARLVEDRSYPIEIMKAVLRNKPAPTPPSPARDWAALAEPEQLIIQHMLHFCQDFNAQPDPF